MSSEQTLDANGVAHRVLLAGETQSPAVVLLHGFPSRGILWEKQMPVLAGAGFFAIAPDLRGAVGGGTTKPKSVEELSITEVIVKDVAGILDALGIKKAHIVGHDWGAAVAWSFAGIFPDRTLDLVAISVGHPSGYIAGAHLAEQKQKCWYMILFNIPGVGEEAIMGGALTKGLISPEAAAAEAPMWEAHKTFVYMQEPGAATNALNWYRANAKPEAFWGDYGLYKTPPVSCDTLQIWPEGDHPFCCEGQAKSSGSWVKPPGTFRYERVQSNSHFALWTDPEPISKLLLQFLTRGPKL